MGRITSSEGLRERQIKTQSVYYYLSDRQTFSHTCLSDRERQVPVSLMSHSDTCRSACAHNPVRTAMQRHDTSLWGHFPRSHPFPWRHWRGRQMDRPAERQIVINTWCIDPPANRFVINVGGELTFSFSRISLRICSLCLTLCHTHSYQWHHTALIQSTVTWYLLFYCEVVTSGVCVHTGWLTWNLVGILLRMAESKSWGRLVAPIMITWQTDRPNIQIINVNKNCVCLYLCTCRCVSVSSPSHRLMNWAFIMAVASWSELDRLLRNESVYIITGSQSHQSHLINETIISKNNLLWIHETV